MASVPQPKEEGLTYGDYLRWTQEGRREIIDGIVYDMSPAPATDHQYQRGGVKEYWIVHPTHRIVTVHLLGADGEYGRSKFYSEKDEVRSAALPGLSVNLQNVFERVPSGRRKGAGGRGAFEKPVVIT